jgi:hypothetical protein
MFSKNTLISNKIHLVGAEIFLTGVQADRQTDLTKLIIGFPDFANAARNKLHLESLLEKTIRESQV